MLSHEIIPQLETGLKKFQRYARKNHLQAKTIGGAISSMSREELEEWTGKFLHLLAATASYQRVDFSSWE